MSKVLKLRALNKTNSTPWTFSLIFAMTLALAACGGKEQDPTKASKYQTLKAGVPLKEKCDPAKTICPETTASAMVKLYNIESKGDTTFTQNVESSIVFNVNTSFSNPNEIDYVLNLKSESLSKLGAKFQKSGRDSWTLTWKPSADVLSSNEDSKTFEFTIQFALTNKTSAAGFKQFEGQVDYQNFAILLQKNTSQPMIKDDVKITPAAILNPDQNAKIQFTVLAKSFDKKQSITINRSANTTQSEEMAQMSALWGITSEPRLVSSAEVDKEGYTRFVFEFDFDTRLFADQVLKRIKETGSLQARFNKGEITTAEASMTVEAVNQYNGKKSGQKMITFNVNLKDKPGKAVFGSTSQTMTVKAGSDSNKEFFIRASDGRSEIKIDNVKVLDKVLELKTLATGESIATYSNDNDEVSVSLSCSKSKPSVGEVFSCKTGICSQTCNVDVQTKCSTKVSKLPLVITTVSTLGKEKENSDLIYTIQVSNKNSKCKAEGVAQ